MEPLSMLNEDVRMPPSIRSLYTDEPDSDADSIDSDSDAASVEDIDETTRNNLRHTINSDQQQWDRGFRLLRSLWTG